MIDLKAIRAAAEAAPQDRLHVRHDFGAYYSLRHYPGDYYQGRIRGKERAEYIATANPATMLELLDRLEAAEKDAARLNWLVDNDVDAAYLFATISGTFIRDTVDAAMKDEQK